MVAMLFLTEMFIYLYVWRKYYSDLMEVTYARLGHWMIVAVYGIMLLIFTAIFEGWRIGYLRNFNMVYAQALTSICANTMIYFQIVLLTRHFYSAFPIIAMTAIDIIIISFWSPITLFIFRKIYPPRKVILIYAAHWKESAISKFNARLDCLQVTEKINIIEGLDRILPKTHEYDGVIICDVPSEIRNKILKYCYDNSIRTYTTPKISDIIMRSSETIYLSDTPLLLSRNSGLSVEQKIIKRLFDIFASLIGIILFSPIMLIIAIAIKFDDKGPVFFKQKRCTDNGRVFEILKFRSMIVNAEKDGKVIPTVDNDSRITRVGKFIRKVRLDELPQLFNILKGEMSVVGPRPERIEHVDKYTKEVPEFRYREKVKAGLTGYAQVYGKYNTTAYDKLKMDLIYIQNYKFILDIEILFQTIKILFEKESTEGFKKENSSSKRKTDKKANKVEENKKKRTR